MAAYSPVLLEYEGGSLLRKAMANAEERVEVEELFAETWNDLKWCLPDELLHGIRVKLLEDYEKWRRAQSEKKEQEESPKEWLKVDPADKWFTKDLERLVTGGSEALKQIEWDESYNDRREHLERDKKELAKISGLSRILFTTLLPCPWISTTYKAFLCACSLDMDDDGLPFETFTTLQGGTTIDILGRITKKGFGGIIWASEGDFDVA